MVSDIWFRCWRQSGNALGRMIELEGLCAVIGTDGIVLPLPRSMGSLLRPSSSILPLSAAFTHSLGTARKTHPPPLPSLDAATSPPGPYPPTRCFDLLYHQSTTP
jgi:hypothetical protein